LRKKQDFSLRRTKALRLCAVAVKPSRSYENSEVEDIVD